jgi:hypothetical protein
MAIVISKNSGLNDDFWKPTAQVVNAVLKDADSEKTEYDKIVSEIAVEKKSNKYAEKQTSVTALANFEIVPEGDTAPLDDIQEGTPKLIVHSQFMKELHITAEMVEDDQTDTIKAAAQNFVNAYKRSRCQLATNFIAAEGSTFTFGSKTGLDRATGDGKGLFATDHVGVKANVASQSNVFTNAFSADILIRLASIGRNFKSESGIVTGYAFNKIIIPGNCWQLEETIKRLIASDQIISSNYNDVNTQKGKWTLVVDPLWEAAEGKAPFILMSDEANKAYNGTVFYDRIGLDMKNEVDIHTRNLLYNGRARMSIGANNWRHVIMGGADVGTTLS